MAKKQVLKTILWVMSAPQLGMSKYMEGFSSGRFAADLERCLDCVDQHHSSVPHAFIVALIEAEDHRNAYHPGVDPIGMLRAIWIRLMSGRVQGASTIEQQFVRVVTGRYERTVSRKVREQLLATAVARHRAKESIASAYLAIAFYGSDSSGLDGLKSNFGPCLSNIDQQQALKFVSQLKYPRPLRPSVHWHNKINARAYAIWERQEWAADKSLQKTLGPPPFN